MARLHHGYVKERMCGLDNICISNKKGLIHYNENAHEEKTIK